MHLIHWTWSLFKTALLEHMCFQFSFHQNSRLILSNKVTKTKDSDPSFIWICHTWECSIFCILISPGGHGVTFRHGSECGGGHLSGLGGNSGFTLFILTSAFSLCLPWSKLRYAHGSHGWTTLVTFMTLDLNLKYFIFTCKCYPLTLFQAGGLDFPQDFYFCPDIYLFGFKISLY